MVAHAQFRRQEQSHKHRSAFFWSLAPSAACRSLGTNAHKQLLFLGFRWDYDEPRRGRHRQASLLNGMHYRSAVLELLSRCHNSCGRSTCCRLKGRARKIQTQLQRFLKGGGPQARNLLKLKSWLFHESCCGQVRSRGAEGMSWQLSGSGKDSKQEPNLPQP